MKPWERGCYACRYILSQKIPDPPFNNHNRLAFITRANYADKNAAVSHNGLIENYSIHTVSPSGDRPPEWYLYVCNSI
jgi:hypothetical protein